MKTIRTYNEFNHHRYGNPWVAIVDTKTGKPDFGKKVGGYTGAYGAGEAGNLYIIEPIEGAVYAYGQKDYRGNNGGFQYVKVVNGEFVHIEKQALVAALNKADNATPTPKLSPEYRSQISQLVQTAVCNCIVNGSGVAKNDADGINEGVEVRAEWDTDNGNDILVSFVQCGKVLFTFTEHNVK